MPLSTNLQNLATRVSTEVKSLRVLMTGGPSNLSGLTTTTKANLVAAINELDAAVDAAAQTGGAVIDDGAVVTSSTWSSSKIDSEIDSNVNAAVTALVNGAPLALDTLKELADALENAATDSEVAAILTALDNRVRFDAAQTLTGPQQVQARSNIGAGTSSLVIGTGASNAKAGNWNPTSANITDTTATGISVMTATDATAARTAIGAGTSNLIIGTQATQAKAGNYSPPAATETVSGISELATIAEATAGTDTVRAVTPAGLKAVANTKAEAVHAHIVSDISDVSFVGAEVMKASTAAVARAAIGAGTSSYTPTAATESAQGIIELATTAEATAGTDTTRAITPAGLKAVADTKAALTHTHTASQISDASTVGRNVLTGSTAAAILTTIGAASASAVGNTEIDLVAIFEAGLV